jgi:hypothetical protein
MPQIQFPIPGTEETEEVTGISLGEHAGVETFIVVLPSGHLAVRNKAPQAAAPDETATQVTE